MYRLGTCPPLEAQLRVDPLHGQDGDRQELVELEPEVPRLLDLLAPGAPGEALFLVAALEELEVDRLELLRRMHQGRGDDEAGQRVDGEDGPIHRRFARNLAGVGLDGVD